MSDFIRRRDQWIKQVCMSPALNGTQTRVLTMFAFHADNQTGESFISNRALGEECAGASEQTVSRAMSAGKSAGFIYEVSRGGTSTGKRLTSVRRCVLPSSDQTHVNPDGGTVRPPSDFTGTHVNPDGDPRQKIHGTPVRSDYPTKPLTNPLTNPDNSLGNTSLGNVREEEPTMSGFDRFMAESEAKSAQATASSSEGTLTEEEINEHWNELNDSTPDEDHKEVAALPAGDKDETSSGESSPVHAGAVALEESTPEPVAVSDGPQCAKASLGSWRKPSPEFYEFTGTTREEYKGFPATEKVALFRNMREAWLNS